VLLAGAIPGTFCVRPLRRFNGRETAVQLVRVWEAERLVIAKPEFARRRTHGQITRLMAEWPDGDKQLLLLVDSTLKTVAAPDPEGFGPFEVTCLCYPSRVNTLDG